MSEFCVGEKIMIKGYLGGEFAATIDGVLTSLPINLETQYGIITKIIPGPDYRKESLYMIKFMCYQFSILVDEDYITKDTCCDDHC